ncbi:MAG: type VI secretion system-associated FHA domain protein, partial [Pseudomonadota bacterium]
FYLVDTSMNGVFVDGSEEAVGPTNPIRLQPNTKLRMGNYRMRVVELITEAGGTPELLPNHNTTHSTSADLSIDLLEESDLAGNIDLEEILDDRIMSSNMSMIAKSPVFENSVGDQTRTGMIDMLITETTQPHSAKVHKLPSARRSTDGTAERRDVSNFRAMLKGLGIEADQVEARQPDDIAFAVGEALRAAIIGIKTMKADRARSKAEMDLSQTQIDVNDMTPRNVEADIVDLLLGRGQLHRDAANNVSHDLKRLTHHQMALRDAAKATFVEVFDQLEPEALQQKLAELGGNRGLFTGSRKASLWDQYCRYFPVLAHREFGEFPAFVREELARAYIAHLQTLAENDN